MDTFNAVIVGGGPAGSTCAWQLRRAGMNVAVLDRAVFPRDKVCAGWITPAVIDLLALDVEQYRQHRVLQPITAFRTGLQGSSEVETRYEEPVSYGIRRCEFDHYLLQRSGARLRCGESVADLRRVDGRWIINGDIATPVLIGAGGHFCPVARRLNPQHPGHVVVATLEMELALSDRQFARVNVAPDTPVLHFCEDLKGYGWCVRKGNFLNIGLGRQDPHGLPGRVQAYVAFLISRQIVPNDLPTQFRGHAYLLADSSPRQCVADGVLLVGDAAGLADPRSGEGIRPAIESGLLAASAILGAQGRYDRSELEPYRQLLKARYATSGGADALGQSLPSWLVRALARGAMRSRWFTRHVVLDRWFLGRHRPALSIGRVERPPVTTNVLARRAG
jgi:flavin-dependent dehydrogenase